MTVDVYSYFANHNTVAFPNNFPLPQFIIDANQEDNVNIANGLIGPVYGVILTPPTIFINPPELDLTLGRPYQEANYPVPSTRGFFEPDIATEAVSTGYYFYLFYWVMFLQGIDPTPPSGPPVPKSPRRIVPLHHESVACERRIRIGF